MSRIAATVLVVTVLTAGCADDSGRDDAGAVAETAAAPAVVVPSTTDAPGELERSPLADLVTPVDDGMVPLDDLDVARGPTPVGITIPDLGIDGAAVRDVGVEPNGEMGIPGATEVGWYRWSASPGADGSAVLAAHVAYNGRDGVFRNLRSLSVGSRFFVEYDDGSRRAFEVAEQAQYGKSELPFDRVFDKNAEPQVVLITCGGDFNRGTSSYDDNIVAYAVPVD